MSEQDIPSQRQRVFRILAILPASLVLASMAAALVYFLYEPKYEASAWLRIRDSWLLERTPGDCGQFVQTQVELIRSPLVLGPAIARDDVRSLPDFERVNDPLKWLRTQLRVKAVGQSELYQVSFAGLDPQGSATLVNAVIEEYFSLRGTEDAEQNQRVIQLLQDELERQEDEAERLREKVRELSIQAVGIDPFAANAESELSTSADLLSELQSQITTAQVQGAVLKGRIKALEEALSGDQVDVPEKRVDRGTAEPPEVQALQETLSAMEARLLEIKATLADGEADPLYQELDREIQSAKTKLKQLRESLRSKMRADMERTVADQRKEELLRMQSDLEGHRLLEQVLRERYEKVLKVLGEYTGETLALELARRDYFRAEEVVEQIASRIMTLRIEQRAPGRVVLMRPAEPSREPVKRLPWATIILVGLGGFLLPPVVMGLYALVTRALRPREL